MSTYDVIMAKRLEEGMGKGLEKGEEKKTEATVRKMLLSEKFKTGVLTMEDIADFAEVSIDYVLDLQKVLDEEAKQDS